MFTKAASAAMWLLVMASVAAAQTTSAPVTVADVIGMSRFGSQYGNDSYVASPDGGSGVALVQKGDLTRNVVTYTLLLFQIRDAAHIPAPDTVVRMESATNEPAISRVHWLPDNRTVVFLGGHPAQIYAVDVVTRLLMQRTHSATGIESFQIAGGGDPLIYRELRGAVDTSRFASMRAHGFVLSPKVWLEDAMAGQWLGSKWDAVAQPGYRIVRNGADSALVVPDSTSVFKDCGVAPEFGPSLSPDGTKLMLVCTPRVTPSWWAKYRNARYHVFADQFHDYGREPVVFDLGTHDARLVAPIVLLAQGETPFVWSPDGRSVLFANALLPLTGKDSSLRVTQRMAVEIELATGRMTLVAPRDSLLVQSWSAKTGLVKFARTFAWFTLEERSPRVWYHKTARGWSEVPPDRAPRTVELAIDQGLNTSPRLAVIDPATHQARPVFDPNAEILATRQFGREEVFHWKSKTGREFAGGLYYPVGFVQGRRYPLVLQTHGFDSTLFAPDGAFTTNTAAQPLAASGVVVLQAGEPMPPTHAEEAESPREAPAEQDMLEGAIDALDQRGLIDRNKVGLQGFSRTCFYGMYFLTHSSYRVAAADMADGVDYGYLQYLTVFQRMGGSYEQVNGGQPWGATQGEWLRNSYSFRLDRITAPLRLTAIGEGSLMFEWEPYAGLMLLHKPVELVYIPEGDHVLVKPWERLTSQQGVFDWFRFWLQGYEDPDSAKTEQYERWRKLRAMHDSSIATSSR